MAARLKARGYTESEMQIIIPPDGSKKGNLVARLKGTGGPNAKKPLMLLAHIDVVEAKREDWERDPFKLVEENGCFYARGSSDDKSMAAINVKHLEMRASASAIRSDENRLVLNKRLASH